MKKRSEQQVNILKALSPEYASWLGEGNNDGRALNALLKAGMVEYSHSTTHYFGVHSRPLHRAYYKLTQKGAEYLQNETA